MGVRRKGARPLTVPPVFRRGLLCLFAVNGRKCDFLSVVPFPVFSEEIRRYRIGVFLVRKYSIVFISIVAVSVVDLDCFSVLFAFDDVIIVLCLA